MDAIFIEKTIDLMKECLTRMETIRDEDISNPEVCPQCEGTGGYRDNMGALCMCPGKQGVDNG